LVKEEAVKYTQRMLSSEVDKASSAKPIKQIVSRKRKAVLEY
jgi:hypothetical protein